MIVLDTRTDDVRRRLASREVCSDASIQTVVATTIASVRSHGDAAVLASAQRFDSDELTITRVSDEELDRATVSDDLSAAIEFAKGRIEAFHRQQLSSLTQGWEASGAGFRFSREDSIGASVGQRLLPVQRAGIYVPGGRASYPSSVLMNAVPAMVAGVAEIMLCTPARRDGTLLPAVLVALRSLGIRDVYKVGGAAAIAAMALGTPSIKACDVIAGPGNVWVNEAKRQLWGTAGFDGFAGPSEVCVLVDDTANPAWVAADIITQIEHAPDNQAFLVGVDASLLQRVIDEIAQQVKVAHRAEIIRDALGHSMAIRCRNMDEACEIVNLIAPEHLTLDVSEPDVILPRVHNAGCVLLGSWTPESAADYSIGPSHTLPTAGAARFASPVNVMTFMKFQSVSRLDEAALSALREATSTLAEAEGFPGHARGVNIRFE